MRWLEEGDKQRKLLGDAWWMYDTFVHLLRLTYERKVNLGNETYLYSGSKDRFDRIISMCAHIEMPEVSVAGMKWVSSRAENLSIGLPRGGAVTVLNDAETGIPLLAFEGSNISLARTAIVACGAVRHIGTPFSMALIGAGRVHDWQARYARQLWPEIKLYVYDSHRQRALDFSDKHDAVVLSDWEGGLAMDVFSLATAGATSTGWIGDDTCTPMKGQIWLNTSLRDIQPKFIRNFPLVVVDDHSFAASQGTPYDRAWQERWVAREMSLADLVVEKKELKEKDFPVLVNPMGLPLWDVGIGYELYSSEFMEEKERMLSSIPN
jgi:ornithine cyclodeaminase/alanine dehydrogenase-like protein (mu-crystallin family)